MASESTVPIGYRFSPTPYEILWYLQNKIQGNALPSDAIMDRDAYSCDPSLLPRMCDFTQEQYYFVERGRKSENGSRPNREVKTAVGWWKTSAKDKPIYDETDPTREVGKLRTLAFHLYRNLENKSTKDSEKTDWIMHEFSLYDPGVQFQQWVVCGIRYRGKLNLAGYTEPLQITVSEEELVFDSTTEAVFQSFEDGGENTLEADRLLSDIANFYCRNL